MKKLVWFMLGAGAGFVLAHLVNKDPRGHELLAEIDARISEFTDHIGDSYRDEQTRLNDLVDTTTDAAPDAAKIAD